MSIAIYKAGASNGAVNLKNALGATLLKSEGSAYRGRADKLLINWGSSSDEAGRLADLTHRANILNTPTAVSSASHKLRCLQVLRDNGVTTVPWFQNLEDAMAHSERGRIYARTVMQGHSGEGIELILSAQDPQFEETQVEDFPFPVSVLERGVGVRFNNTRLFTVGIIGKRQEWRIHVCKGEVILKQLKKRREGFADDEGYTSLVRNVQTGWIYSVNFNPAEYTGLAAVEAEAIKAVEALGLDFGAVDIVERRGSPFVLEVNTAPGLDEEGSTLRAYTDAFNRAHVALTQRGVA